MERTIALWVAYDGTDFCGWQSQPGQRTVQDVLEQAVRRVVRHQVTVFGCGRTDSGVHAARHVSHFVTTCELPEDKLKHAVGSRLAKDLSIIDVRTVHPAFDARSSATSKLYRYRVYNVPGRPVEQFVQRYTYHFWQPLDLDLMREGAAYFIGEMDFSAMAATGCVRESMVRTVLRCDVTRAENEVHIDVEGTGFLYRQVRNMVGTLLNVGRCQWPPERVQEILESRDRTKAGPTAPARGLCLMWVKYPEELLVPPTGSGGVSVPAAGEMSR